jgi:hypothetical protein
MSLRSIIAPAAVATAMLAVGQPALALTPTEIRVPSGFVAGAAGLHENHVTPAAIEPAAGVERLFELPEQPVTRNRPKIETAAAATGHALEKSTELTVRGTEAAGKALARMLEQARPGPLLPPPASWR